MAFLHISISSAILNSENSFTRKRTLLWRFNFSSSNEMFSALHVKCPIFVSGCNQIWLSSTHFRRSTQNVLSHTFVLWKPHWCMRAEERVDGRTDREKDGRTDRDRMANRSDESNGRLFAIMRIRQRNEKFLDMLSLHLF